MHFKRVVLIVLGLIILFIIGVIIVIKTYNYNTLKPRIVQTVKETTGRELDLKGDISLKIGFNPKLVLEEVSFQNAPWGSRPYLATIKRLEVQVAIIPLIRHTIEVKRFILIKPDILIETSSLGQTNLEFEAIKAKETVGKEAEGPLEGIPVVVFNKLAVEDGIFTYRDGQSKTMHSVKLKGLTADAKNVDSPILLNVEGNYNKVSFTLTGSIGSLAMLINPDRPWTLDLTAKAGGVIITAQGSIKDVIQQQGINIDFSIKGKDLNELETLAGASIPAKGPFELAGKIYDIGAEAYKISGLSLHLKDNSLGGSVEIIKGVKKPRFKIDMASNKIDLRPFWPEKETIREGTPAQIDEKKKPERLFSNDPLSFDKLNQVDMFAKIQAVEIILPQLTINNLKTEILLENGYLEVKPFELGLGDGILKGQIQMKPRGETVTIHMEMNGEKLEVGKMLNDLKLTNKVEGELELTVNISTTGRSIAQFMGEANGEFTAIMSKGSIANKYIKIIGSDLSSGVFRLLNPHPEEGDNTDINCFVTRFDIRNGIAQTTAIVFDTPVMTVIGDGTIDLKNEKLDIALKPSPKEGLRKGGIGKITLSLSELTKPFKLMGTLVKPSLAIDPMQAAITIGKAVGGAALFGPAGIAAALVSGSTEEENPCIAALEAAKSGVKLGQEKAPIPDKEAIKEKAKDIMEKTKEDVLEKASEGIKKGAEGLDKETVKKGIKDIGKGLKNIF